jgi:hypothetical protein
VRHPRGRKRSGASFEPASLSQRRAHKAGNAQAPKSQRNLVYIETGKSRCFACSLDWPGLSRSAKGEEAALSALSDYVPRYAVVAAKAGVDFPLVEAQPWSIVDRVPTRSGGADFGAPTAVLESDAAEWPVSEAGRTADLLAASWDLLDKVAAGAPQALRKGPRGGGRDRDAVTQHVAAAEQMYGRKVGLALPVPHEGERSVVKANRKAILDWCRSGGTSAPGRPGWPPRYAARRLIWHVLDHAWEIEDRST